MAKPSLGKRISWRVEVLAYDFLRLILSPLSFDQISAMGGKLVEWIGPLTSKKHIARKGLETAFPDKSKSEIDALIKAQWNNVGRTFAEFPFLHKLDASGESARIKIIGKEKLLALKDSDTPAVLISGHFANWEVMAMVFSQLGVNVQVTYRQINNPHIDRRVREERGAYGIQLMVPKSGAKGAKQLLEALGKNESVAILNDQKFNQGIAVPFFGVDAMTAPGATRLAITKKVPIIPMSTVRDKANFTVTVHDPLPIAQVGDKAENIAATVKTINEFMEDRIRENPDQWFWVHRRWPKEFYK